MEVSINHKPSCIPLHHFLWRGHSESICSCIPLHHLFRRGHSNHLAGQPLGSAPCCPDSGHVGVLSRGLPDHRPLLRAGERLDRPTQRGLSGGSLALAELDVLLSVRPGLLDPWDLTPVQHGPDPPSSPCPASPHCSPSVGCPSPPPARTHDDSLDFFFVLLIELLKDILDPPPPQVSRVWLSV